VFICSIILLLITTLLLIGSFLLNATVLVSLVAIATPYSDIILSDLFINLYNKVSDSVFGGGGQTYLHTHLNNSIHILNKTQI
jgi:hypothetical protein